MMNWLSFHIGKWLQGAPYLSGLSCSQTDLQTDLAGKSIAIIGNARSLEQQCHGAEIDQADIVIRMHAAPLPRAQSHGGKTNWLALAMPVPEDLIEQRAPERLLWMAKKRKRLRFRFARRRGFYLHPVKEWQRMRGQLDAPPTTGVMLIDLVAGSKAAKINLYGFDFCASLSLSGSRRADQVPHDFTAEKRFVEQLLKTDSRLTLNS